MDYKLVLEIKEKIKTIVNEFQYSKILTDKDKEDILEGLTVSIINIVGKCPLPKK